MLIEGMPPFYLFKTFSTEVKQLWHMNKYVLNHPFRQDTSSKQIEMSCFENIQYIGEIMDVCETIYLLISIYLSIYLSIYFYIYLRGQ